MFSMAEVIAVFRNAGLTVEMHEFNIKFYDRTTETYVEEQIPQMAVVNPFTGQYENLENAFNRYMELKKDDILIGTEKIQIYNLFKK